MKVIQFTFDKFTIVVFPKANWVRVIYHHPAPGDDYTIPQFIALLERVAKEKRQHG